MSIADKDLLSIQQARILAENACAAQKRLATFPQEKLDVLVEAVATAMEQHAQDLAVCAQEETDCGKWQDKTLKNRFVCENLRRRLRGMRCVGVLHEDVENRLVNIGVPLGVIVALCPATSPVSTTISTALLALKSGNAVIFSLHPGAVKTMRRALDIMIDAATAHGLPEGTLSYLDVVAKSGTAELMRHPATALICVSGVPDMLDIARESGKPLIYGGTGNGPAFIERSADIPRAVRDVIHSKTFDYGLAPSAEQSLVVDACVDAEVRRALAANGGCFMSDSESQRLSDLFFHPDGRRKKGTIGQPAPLLAERAGFTVPAGTQVLLAERKYVNPEDFYCREWLSPVLAYYVEDDWLHACEKCIELLVTERNAHTLTIHSGDESVIRQFALKKPVARLLVNTPAALGGMGMTTNLFPAMTLGSGVAGFGITSDNLSPAHFTYTRTVGYGVRPAPSCSPTVPLHPQSDEQAIQDIVLAVLRQMGQ